VRLPRGGLFQLVRDLQQARVVAALTAAFLPHLRLDGDDLRMLPKELVAEALPLFKQA